MICLKIETYHCVESPNFYLILNIQFAVLEWVRVNGEAGNGMEMIGLGMLRSILKETRETAKILSYFFLRDHGCNDL